MTHEEIIAAVESMTVLELADLVKAMEEKFGVSAAATAVVAGPAAGAAAPAAEEKTEFDVVLKSRKACPRKTPTRWLPSSRKSAANAKSSNSSELRFAFLQSSRKAKRLDACIQPLFMLSTRFVSVPLDFFAFLRDNKAGNPSIHPFYLKEVHGDADFSGRNR